MNWIRRAAGGDRIRRMLACRVLLAGAVLALWWHRDGAPGDASTWLGWAVGWLAVTALTLFSVRLGDRPARTALTATLLGDGLLLGVAGWALGDLLGGMGVVIVLHAVAVTWFASYRTGVRIAFWHCLVGMLLIDAVALGQLAETGSWTWAGAWPYYAALWGAVLSTAVFAARNQRAARRRDEDEALRQVGRAVAAAPEPAVALAEFGLAELSGRRAAVLAYDGGSGLAALVDGRGQAFVDRSVTSLPVVRCDAEPGFLLRARLDSRTEGWLATALPGARNVVVVPLAGMPGALAVEVGESRVARRAVEKVVEAVRYASPALQLAGVAG